jgi:hypothetical protein
LHSVSLWSNDTPVVDRIRVHADDARRYTASPPA